MAGMLIPGGARVIPILGIPILNRADLLLRCIRSIDYPVDKLVIVNNGKDPGVLAILDQLQTEGYPDLEVYTPGFNMGVAASWNYVMRKHPFMLDSSGLGHGYYWMFVGNDIQLSPGDLAKMDRFIPSIGLSNHPGKLGPFLAVTPAALKASAGDESCIRHSEIRLSAAQLQAHKGRCQIFMPFIKPPGPSTVWSDPVKKKCGITKRTIRIYAQMGQAGEETFKTPFDDPL
jgi:glycosyltransferase involved in cell wall biosynthesis